MSNVKWNPPPPGGPSTRSPVKVVFEGVPPGSPLAYDLMQTFRGQINRFYLGQAQNARLGPLDYSKTHTTDGPLWMQYANLQGQEIVRVRVRKEVIEKVAKKKPKRQKDFILITFEYPEGFKYKVYHQAYLKVPEMVPDVKGYALEDVMQLTDDNSETPIISFPPLLQTKARWETPIEVVATGLQYSTLLIDLRPARGFSAVIVDVHAWCSVSGLGGDCTPWRWERDPDGGLDPSEPTTVVTYRLLQSHSGTTGPGPVNPDDYWVPFEAWTQKWNLSSYPTESIFQSDPPQSWPEFAQLPTNPLDTKEYIMADDAPDGWSGVIELDPQRVYGEETLGEVTVSPAPWSGDGSATYVERRVVEQYNFPRTVWNLAYQRSGQATAIGNVTAMFPGGDFDIVNPQYTGLTSDNTPCDAYLTSQNFRAWVDAPSYPERPVHQRLGQVSISSTEGTFVNSMAERYGRKKICTITYDKEHDSLSMKSY